ncbi:hypothetical protein O3Q51_03815 [Cryomorphaceae bacterium 1068]|nr:hypothetical protein [Cryomorphaceae bacterium 1068]
MNKSREVHSKLLAIIFFLAIALSGIAQERSLGLRLGWGGGLSYVQSITESQDFELILTPRWGGIILTGLYERRVPLSSGSWNWYYGGGLHGGYHHRNNFIGEGFNGDPPYINLGFDLIVGIKYRFDSLPIEFSVDYKPSIELLANRNLLLEEFAISFRYLIFQD